MPGRKKGGKHVRRKTGALTEEKLILRDEGGGEVYARVSAACGSGRFMVKLVQYDETNAPILAPSEVLGILPGRMRRRKWKHFVTVNDYVLVQQRSFQTEQNKVDILHKYDAGSAKKLAKMRAVPDDYGEEILFGEDDGSRVDGVGGSADGVGSAGAASVADGQPAGAPMTKDSWEEGFDFDEI